LVIGETRQGVLYKRKNGEEKNRIDESPNGILLHSSASLMIFIDQESTTIGIVICSNEKKNRKTTVLKRKAMASS